MSKECEYCHECKEITGYDDEYFNKKISEKCISLGKIGDLGVNCSIDSEEKELNIYVSLYAGSSDDGYDEVNLLDQYVKINYCPMCGRKIRDEQVDKK